MYLISFESYTSVKKFYSFITFNLLIEAVILLLNRLVLILCPHSCVLFYMLSSLASVHNIHCLFWKSPDLYAALLLLYFMVFNAFSPSYGVRTSLMLFLTLWAFNLFELVALTFQFLRLAWSHKLVDLPTWRQETPKWLLPCMYNSNSTVNLIGSEPWFNFLYSCVLFR